MIKLSFHQIINRARAEPMMQAGHNKNSHTNRRRSPFFNYALLVYSSTSASTSSVSAHSTADSASCSMSVFLRLEICLRAFNTDDALMENSSRPSPSSSGIAFSSPAISPAHTCPFSFFVSCIDHHLDKPQKRRMIWLIQVADCFVHAVCCHCILNQIVCADGEEVHNFRKLVCDDCSG